MESTRSCWKPVFNILEGSLKIILANPEQVKALRGKKTDPKDSRWLAGCCGTDWCKGVSFRHAIFENCEI
jgi:transposase